MGLRVDSETFLLGVRECAESGIASIEYEADGSVAKVGFHDWRDTEPCVSHEALMTPEIPPPARLPSIGDVTDDLVDRPLEHVLMASNGRY